jgi:hypothetical protein
MTRMANEKRTSKFDLLEQREDRILRLLKEERNRAKKKFPLLYALLATFGLVSTVAGLNKFIEDIEWLNNDPLYLVGLGLIILFITGAAYRKLG